MTSRIQFETFIVLVSFAAWLGCSGQRPSPPSPTEVREAAQETVVKIAEALANTGVELGCGSPNEGVPAVFVTATMRHCLSCRGMGRLLRKLSQESRQDGGKSFWIVTPDGDAGDVCDFVRREKVGAVTVAALPENLFPDSALFRDIIFAEPSYGSPEAHVMVHGRTVDDVLRQLLLLPDR